MLTLVQKRRPLGRLFCALFLATALFAAACAQAGQGALVLVAKVIDGDTLILETGAHVRLQGIDAPELGHGREPDQYYGREATRRLQSLAEGKRVRVVESASGKDHYGRVLGLVYLADGVSLNELLVREGLAFVYTHEDLDPGEVTRLVVAQREAMDAGVGFWPVVLRREGAAPCLGNRHTLRFFPARCAMGKKISVKNRVVFATLKDAFWAGFSPARPCGFWPEAGGR